MFSDFVSRVNGTPLRVSPLRQVVRAGNAESIVSLKRLDQFQLHWPDHGESSPVPVLRWPAMIGHVADSGILGRVPRP